MNVGTRIKEYRKKAKMSQKELAEKIGKGSSTVQKYELNLTQPPIDVLNKIADVLNIGTSMLISDDEEPTKMYIADDLFKGVGGGVFKSNKHEYTITDYYERLNKRGQRKATSYVRDLSENPKYKKSPP